MSDASAPDTGDVSTTYCPACEPERDPFEGVLRIVWCLLHFPPSGGDADDEARAHGISGQALSSSGDAVGDESNRAACDVVHRGKAKAEPKEGTMAPKEGTMAPRGDA